MKLIGSLTKVINTRWVNAWYAIACDMEANKHYGDADSLSFHIKLFAKTFFKLMTLAHAKAMLKEAEH